MVEQPAPHRQGAGSSPASGTMTTINAGYALEQLRRAVSSRETNPDEAARARAEGRVRRWEQVLAGLSTGSIAVGSRTPLLGVPAWVTLRGGDRRLCHGRAAGRRRAAAARARAAGAAGRAGRAVAAGGAQRVLPRRGGARGAGGAARRWALPRAGARGGSAAGGAVAARPA